MSVSNLGIDGLEDVEQIGTGGSSRVYRARQADLDRIVAVKVLNPGHDQGVSKRFDRERKAMGRLSLHEGIVPVYSSGLTSHGEPYLVMPYYANGSLQDQIDTGAMEWQTAVSYVDVAAETIAAAHEEGVVHLDLKPANILLTNQGAPRIADFGIAKLTTGQGASAGTTGGAAFTPAYSAPETFLDGETGPPSDVYGLGATLWALLVGHPPFLTPGDDTNLMAVIGRVVNNPVGDLRHFTPGQICDVIEKAMAKEPEDRYQTARDFSLALKNAAASASPDFQPVVEEPKGTILFPGPPQGTGTPIGSGSGSDTQLVTRMDPVDLPPAIASTAPAASSAPPQRPLLQETAQALPKPAGGPPPVAANPIFDLDRFRFGPILLGVLAFLGVIGVAFWALNRSPGTEASDSGTEIDVGVTVTDPASPSVEGNSDQSVTASTALGGGSGGDSGDGGDGGSSSSSTPTTGSANPGSTAVADTTTTTEAATTTTDDETTTTSEATTTTGDETTTTSEATTTTSEATTTTRAPTTTTTRPSTTTTEAETTTTTEAETTTTTEAPTTTTTAATTTTISEEPPVASISTTSADSDSVRVSFRSDQCIDRYRVSANGPNQSTAVASDDFSSSGGCRKSVTAVISGLQPSTTYNLTLTVFNAAGKFDQDTGSATTSG